MAGGKSVPTIGTADNKRRAAVLVRDHSTDSKFVSADTHIYIYTHTHTGIHAHTHKHAHTLTRPHAYPYAEGPV